MTNEEWLRALTHDQLIAFLDSLDSSLPWFDEFDKKICATQDCENCVAPNCSFGDPIEWWLRQEHNN